MPLFELLKPAVVGIVLSEQSVDHRQKVTGYFGRLNNYSSFATVL